MHLKVQDIRQIVQLLMEDSGIDPDTYRAATSNPLELAYLEAAGSLVVLAEILDAVQQNAPHPHHLH